MNAIRNGMRPIHPGEILHEEFLVPLHLSANALAIAQGVSAPRINDIARERLGVTVGTIVGQIGAGRSIEAILDD